MHPPSQQNCNERVARSASPPCCQQYAYLGNTVDKTNSHCQIIPAFVTALSYYPTRWVHVQWGVLLSHLSSLKAALRRGNGGKSTQTAPLIYVFSVAATPNTLFVRRRSPQVPQGDSCFSEMGLFKYKYVYKGTSNDSLFLANKTLNTILNEGMEISCVPFKNEKKSIVTAFND